MAQETLPQEWIGKYTQLRRLPCWFIISWMAERAVREDLGALTRDIFCALEESDHEKLIMLLTYCVQLPECQTLPAECQDQRVMVNVLHLRAEAVGKRLSELYKSGGFETSGNIDYSSACYKFHWAMGYVVRVEHPTSGTIVDVPHHMYIDNSFGLFENHMDHLAMAKAPGTKHLLNELFAGENFLEQMVTFTKKILKLNQYAKTEATSVSRFVPQAPSTEEQAALDDVKQTMLEVQKKRKTAATDAAQKILKARELEKKDLKRVKLNPSKGSDVVEKTQDTAAHLQNNVNDRTQPLVSPANTGSERASAPDDGADEPPVSSPDSKRSKKEATTPPPVVVPLFGENDEEK